MLLCINIIISVIRLLAIFKSINCFIILNRFGSVGAIFILVEISVLLVGINKHNQTYQICHQFILKLALIACLLYFFHQTVTKHCYISFVCT